MTYETEYGFQGVEGIMADYGIRSFSDFDSELEIRTYFKVDNIIAMFGHQKNPLSQAKLDEIADEFISEWGEERPDK